MTKKNRYLKVLPKRKKVVLSIVEASDRLNKLAIKHKRPYSQVVVTAATFLKTETRKTSDRNINIKGYIDGHGYSPEYTDFEYVMKFFLDRLENPEYNQPVIVDAVLN